jgi:hypothetical protein
MANKFQVKRTTVSGRTPNTTSSGNSRFIDTGELALNLPDGKLFSSNGSVYFEIGANLASSNIAGDISIGGNASFINGTSNAVLRYNYLQLMTAPVGGNTKNTYITSNEITITSNVGLSSFARLRSTGTGLRFESANLNSGSGAIYLTTDGATTNTVLFSAAGVTNATVEFVTDVKFTGGVVANGSYGSAGQQLVSNGTSVYWSSNSSSNTVTANTLTANVISGENLTINQGISVGNTTVNTSINATAIFSGNTTSNSLVSPTQIAAANTTSNSTINPSTIFVGNSTSNAIVSINQVDTTISTITSVDMGVQGNPAWIALYTPGGNTNLPSGAATDYYGSSYVKITNVHPWLNDVNWGYNPIVANSTCLGYFWDPSLLGNALKIKSFTRTSGNVVVETVAAHSANTTTFPSGFTAKFNNLSAPPSGLVNTNSIQTLNVINTTAFWYTVPSTPYKNLTISNLLFPNGYYQYTGPVTAPVMLSTLQTLVSAAGYFVYFIETSTAHGIANGSTVVVSGVTNTPRTIGTVSYQWNGTYKAWTSAPGANSTYFAVLVAPKAAKGAVPSAQTGPVAATGTPRVVTNIDVTHTPPTPSYIAPVNISFSPSGPSASLRQTDPVVLQVANTVTRVRITPRNIFVGNTSGGTYTIIDQSKITAAKRGSFLSSSVSGDGIRVESLIDELSSAEANADFFFANATVMQIGNSSVGSIITSNTVSSQLFSVADVDDSRSNVTIASTGVTINTTDSDTTYSTTITSKAATFSGSVQVSSALVLDSTLLANGNPGAVGQVLTSSNTGNVYWSSVSGGTMTWSSTPPSSPAVGDEWIDTDTGIKYTYTNDGDSYQWIEFGTNGLSSSTSSSEPTIHPFMLAGM